MNDILICIVLYKQKFEESETVKTILHSKININDLSIVIYDNSPTPQAMPKSHSYQLFYIHDEANSGVSKAYNEAAKIAQKLNKKWLLLFDQDTQIHAHFFKELQKAINSNPNIHLFVPKLKTNNLLISPFTYKYGRGWVSKGFQPNINSIRGVSILNSSICVSIEAYMNVGGFDEIFPLYYSDLDFIESFKKKYYNFYLLDITNIHGLSVLSDETINTVKDRYNILTHASIIFAKKHNTFLPIFWCCVRGVKLSLTYLDFGFIRIFLKHF